MHEVPDSDSSDLGLNYDLTDPEKGDSIRIMHGNLRSIKDCSLVAHTATDYDCDIIFCL